MKKVFNFAMVLLVILSIVACDKDYADINHVHDGYADINHTHNEKQSTMYTFNIQFAATVGEDANCVKDLPETIDENDVVLVYGKSHYYTDAEAYDAWPVTLGLISYSYTVCFGTKIIGFTRRIGLADAPGNAETIAMRVIVIPATVVVSAKAANVNVDDYTEMTDYLYSIGEQLEVQTIEDNIGI